MATYYSSPGSERESQDMYSRDPGNASYPMSSALGNLLYLNNNPSSGPYTAEFSGILQTQQNFMEMPGHGHHPAMSQDSSARESHDMLASHHGQRPFGHVKDMKDEMLMHMMDGARSGGGELIHDDPHNGAQFEFGVLNNHDSSDVPVGQGQGLSLSLNTQILAPSLPYWSIKPDMLTPNSYQESLRIDDIRMKNMQSEASRAIRHSRYLKAAQEVLDEVVNVWKNIKRKAQKEQAEPGKADGKESDGGPKSEGASQESGANAAPELSTAEKQELQNKMAKLMAMLDEVDRKYKHYYHQMQNVVASFDMVAGPGSAKPYTAVALQTISRHFRCLKDAINDQINVIRKKLGEEENSSGKEGKLTRLRYIDQQLRQQRAFQQYGMIPQNAWRPQRGLPENSVTVLRAWLFEHFLHPYPKDSEKLMLARQTGLTRSQISNWFINARVRLWKPMIEDMYKEETGDLEQDSNSSSDNVPRSKNKVASSEENEDLKNARARVCETSQLSESRASIGTMIVGAAPVGFQHAEANPDDSFMNLMMKEQRSGEADGGLLLHNAVAQHSDENARFMAYHLAELGRYGNGNVSLTLGLQHPGSGLSVPNAQAHFPGVGDDDIYNAGAPLGVGIASSDYESLNQMDQRQRFEQSPLLHDFVA